MSKILFLNPSYEQKIIKDQYCSNSSKSNYFWAPIDFIVTSGFCSADDEVYFYDDIAEETERSKSLQRILELKPEFIVALTSALTWKHDRDFFRDIKSHIKTQIILMGSNVYFRYGDFLGDESIDYVATDFPARIDLVLKNDECLRNTKLLKTSAKNNYPPNTPIHSLFISNKYSHPFFNSDFLWTSILINHSCPYKCSYCPVQGIEFETGSIDKAIQEIEYLTSININQIWIRDLTFSASSKNSSDLCRKILEKNLKFTWSCEDRYELLNYEKVKLMRDAGCAFISLGFETASETILNSVKRTTSLKKLNEVLNSTSRLGVQTHLYILLGLPNESHKSIARTLLFLITCKANFITINTFVPRDGSTFQENTDASYMDSSKPSKSFCKLNAATLDFYKNIIYIFFYLSPYRLFFYVNLGFNDPKKFRHYFHEGISLVFPMKNRRRTAPGIAARTDV